MVVGAGGCWLFIYVIKYMVGCVVAGGCSGAGCCLWLFIYFIKYMVGCVVVHIFH
jgi:hypothetical protein